MDTRMLEIGGYWRLEAGKMEQGRMSEARVRHGGARNPGGGGRAREAREGPGPNIDIEDNKIDKQEDKKDES